MEDDLRGYAPRRSWTSPTRRRPRLEALIRGYDPCISCATHFLDLTIEEI